MIFIGNFALRVVFHALVYLIRAVVEEEAVAGIVCVIFFMVKLWFIQKNSDILVYDGFISLGKYQIP